MKISRQTVFWSAVLVLSIVAIVYLLKMPNAHHGEESEHGSGPTLMFNFTVDDLKAVEIIMNGAFHRVERTSTGSWYMHDMSAHHHKANPEHVHQVVPEVSNKIIDALGLLCRARLDRHISTGSDMLKQYSLDQPPIIVLVYNDLKAPPLVTLHGGDKTASGLGWYVRMVEKDEIVLIPAYHLANLKTLLQIPISNQDS